MPEYSYPYDAKTKDGLKYDVCIAFSVTEPEYTSKIGISDIQKNNLSESVNNVVSGGAKTQEEKWYKASLAREEQKISQYNINNRSVQLYFPSNFSVNDRATYNMYDVSTGVQAIKKLAEGESYADAFSTLGSLESILSRFSMFDQDTKSALTLFSNRSADPNSLMLFQKPEIREFSFDFNLKPTSSAEMFMIENIIEFFRYELYPTKISDGRMYKVPNHFKIQIKHKNNKKVLGLDKVFKTNCVLRSMNTNYNPSNMSFYEHSNDAVAPSEINLSLSFQEINALSKQDFELSKEALIQDN